MKLNGKHILLISPEPWEGLHMSKHHLSQGLVKRGNSVVFLDPPSNAPLQVESMDGIHVVRYSHWLRGINHMPRAIHLWYYTRLIRRIEALVGKPFDIIWNFDTSRMQWFPNGLGYRILHLADYNILHQGMGLVRTADVVLTTGQVVKDHLEQRMGVEVHNVGHALDERWMRDSDNLHMNGTSAPKSVVYAGQLALHYHDWDGWLDIAEAHPELSFTFIGPYDSDLPEPAFHSLRSLPHVTFTGLMKKDALVPKLREADILLFGFRSATVAKERANPHKVLEYLSTGNIIVGSWTMEYASMPDLFCMAPQGAPLLPTFNDALARFSTLNSSKERLRRMEFARQRSIPQLIDRIEALTDGQSS